LIPLPSHSLVLFAFFCNGCLPHPPGPPSIVPPCHNAPMRRRIVYRASCFGSRRTQLRLERTGMEDSTSQRQRAPLFLSPTHTQTHTLSHPLPPHCTPHSSRTRNSTPFWSAYAQRSETRAAPRIHSPMCPLLCCAVLNTTADRRTPTRIPAAPR
jgi:hypothetical protein